MAGVDFQAQIASIMEALSSAAVAQICKVIDAVIELQVSRSRRENELLRERIRVMERASLHARSPCASAAGFTQVKRPTSSRTDHSTADEHGGLSDQAITVKDEPTDPEDEPDVLIVKEEKLQTVCSASSFGEELSAKANTSQMERVCTAGSAAFPSVGPDDEPGKRRRDSEEGKVTVRTEAAVHCVKFDNDVDAVKDVDHSEATVCVDIKTACEGTETPAFDHKHAEFLPAQQSCSDADVKPDFFIIEPRPAEELDRQLECQQKGTDEPVGTRHGLQYRDGHSPSSEKRFLGFVGSFSSTSRDHLSWTCDQQRGPNGGPQTLRGDAPWSCRLCGKSFSHMKQLKLHERVHTEEKVYRCGRCGRQFPQLCRLKRHERVHTGEKPFRCAKCGKHFAHANNLKVHQSVHTGERRFSCAQCGKSFSFLSNLIRHKAVHTGK